MTRSPFGSCMYQTEQPVVGKVPFHSDGTFDDIQDYELSKKHLLLLSRVNWVKVPLIDLLDHSSLPRVLNDSPNVGSQTARQELRHLSGAIKQNKCYSFTLDGFKLPRISTMSASSVLYFTSGNSTLS